MGDPQNRNFPFLLPSKPGPERAASKQANGPKRHEAPPKHPPVRTTRQALHGTREALGSERLPEAREVLRRRGEHAPAGSVMAVCQSGAD